MVVCTYDVWEFPPHCMIPSFLYTHFHVVQSDEVSTLGWSLFACLPRCCVWNAVSFRGDFTWSIGPCSSGQTAHELMKHKYIYSYTKRYKNNIRNLYLLFIHILLIISIHYIFIIRYNIIYIMCKCSMISVSLSHACRPLARGVLWMTWTESGM